MLKALILIEWGWLEEKGGGGTRHAFVVVHGLMGQVTDSQDVCNIAADRRQSFAGRRLMYQRALAGFEKVLGADHTSTLHALSTILGFYVGPKTSCARASRYM